MNKRAKLKKITDSKTFWMVMSVLIAFFLWMYVTSTEGVETEKTINGVKVVFVGEEALRESSGLVITEQDAVTVDVTLSGTRRVLSKLTNSTVTAVVDLSNVYTDARYSVAYSLSYPNGVGENEVTVVRSSLDVINFTVDRLSTKTVEVKGIFSGTMAEGYIAEKTLQFDPLAVKISGPKTAVELVDHAFVTITREGVDKTLQYNTTYELRDAENNVIDDDSIIREVTEVSVTLPVLSTKQVPLDVTIINGGGATRENNVDIDIDPEFIMLAGDAEAIDGATKILLGTIDLSDFATDYEMTYAIVPPNDTENMTGITEATVRITIKGLETKTFTIQKDNISCINTADSMAADVITESLTITVRAAPEILENIKANNLRAVADLAEFGTTAGVYNPNVRISIDGFPDAGVIGDYTIHVTLSAG